MSPQERFSVIHAKVITILRQEQVSVCNATLVEGSLQHWNDDTWRLGQHYGLIDNPCNADILIINGTGGNHIGLRHYLEQQGFKGLLCFWLHDNHIAHENNKATVAESDFYFCSHYGSEHENYLLNELSIAGPIVPACFNSIPLDTVKFMLNQYGQLPRLSKVVAPYIMYDMPRSKILKELQSNCPELVCLFTPVTERAEKFWTLSLEERAIRWLFFKSSIAIPVYRDLSTRIFDGLIWGHTVLAPSNLPAFDYVINEADQVRLGIIRYDESDGIKAISDAANKAIQAFDLAGPEGVAARHDYVLTAHLREHRIISILIFLENFASGYVTNQLLLGEGISGLKSVLVKN